MQRATLFALSTKIHIYTRQHSCALRGTGLATFLIVGSMIRQRQTKSLDRCLRLLTYEIKWFQIDKLIVALVLIIQLGKLIKSFGLSQVS